MIQEERPDGYVVAKNQVEPRRGDPEDDVELKSELKLSLMPRGF